ncbi:uncharacterized protein [Branchiostoma lanceolatum]|uniref:uncharacterized protein n=1 Tax=Branchiostoma lanceolatum TaxID=7740 RepID=UPI003452B5A3
MAKLGLGLAVVVAFAICLVVSSLPSSGCPNEDYDPFNGVCYKYFAVSKKYDEARQTCATDWGTLAMPKDTETNAFIAHLGSGETRWIGLTDAASEGQWVFQDGQTLESTGYSNWDGTEPDGGTGENCAALSRTTGSPWVDVKCNSDRKLICQIDPGCPKQGYVRFKGVCYKYFDEDKKTYDEAKETCAADGGMLAMPKDNAANNFIARLGGDSDKRWIGLTDATSEGQWVFQDGQTPESTGYSQWKQDKPTDDDDKNCAVLLPGDLEWEDMKCSQSERFICQLYQAQKTTAAPSSTALTTSTTTTTAATTAAGTTATATTASMTTTAATPAATTTATTTSTAAATTAAATTTAATTAATTNTASTTTTATTTTTAAATTAAATTTAATTAATTTTASTTTAATTTAATTTAATTTAATTTATTTTTAETTAAATTATTATAAATASVTTTAAHTTAETTAAATTTVATTTATTNTAATTPETTAATITTTSSKASTTAADTANDETTATTATTTTASTTATTATITDTTTAATTAAATTTAATITDTTTAATTAAATTTDTTTAATTTADITSTVATPEKRIPRTTSGAANLEASALVSTAMSTTTGASEDTVLAKVEKEWKTILKSMSENLSAFTSALASEDNATQEEWNEWRTGERMPREYNKNASPQTEEKFEVTSAVAVLHAGPLSEENANLSVTVEYTMAWVDPRLRGLTTHWTPVPASRMWAPPLSFGAAVRRAADVTKKGKRGRGGSDHDISMWLHPSGILLHRLT